MGEGAWTLPRRRDSWGVVGGHSRCFSWRRLEVHGVLPSPAEEKERGEWTPHHCWPDTGRPRWPPQPLLSGCSLAEQGVGRGIPPAHPYHPQICALYTFVHDEAGALMPLPGKAGPGHLSTFACSPSWSRCLCGLLSALTLTHEGHHGPADNRKALPLVQPLS